MTSLSSLLKLTITVGIIAMALTQPSYADTLQIYTWTAPTSGTPVHHYLVCLSVDGVECVTLTMEPSVESAQFTFEDNREYTVAVRAVDAEGHMGGWSQASIPYTYGAPGLCGRPKRED